MHAKPGDYLKISGHRVGESARRAEILEVRGDNGGPPCYVRWPDGHESLIYPGPDVIIEHTRRKASRDPDLPPKCPADGAGRLVGPAWNGKP